MQLRLKYVPAFRKVLSGRETALFYQLDWRSGLAIDVELVAKSANQSIVDTVLKSFCNGEPPARKGSNAGPFLAAPFVGVMSICGRAQELLQLGVETTNTFRRARNTLSSMRASNHCRSRLRRLALKEPRQVLTTQCATRVKD